MAQRFNRSNRQAVLHYFTINIRDRKQPFRHDAYALAALLELRAQCDQHPAKLIAYGAMPDHLHGIANPRDGNMQRFLSQYKPAVTNAVVNIARLTHQQRVIDWIYKGAHAELWQDGKHSFHLYSDWMIWQKINYIHNNLIKAGLVKHACEYLYSSFAAMYDVEQEPIIPIDHDWWWEDLPIIFEE